MPYTQVFRRFFNDITPGQIATELAEGWSDEAVEAVENDELIKPVLLERAGFPEDMVAVTAVSIPLRIVQ